MVIEVFKLREKRWHHDKQIQCGGTLNVYCRFMNPPLIGFITTDIIALVVLKRNER